ncbi:TauD/TfdA family dioxygenase [Pseudosporangium ferrugineum]|uniref:Alpha-ketoglutarate-dependent taurine dioxygenase n=1 Tax=Pseudosporangium ferrugineum TaxID=439699 RepID=A0A2T0RFJ3_9ACTN|nr:TauD/TfdA family dioxygenase [Pseudosporangium ferrugineum]PRY19891.1 alpha-ketoglutarate-dependent taurine dioxygenase [Pseudosporangium ferrugineum]
MVDTASDLKPVARRERQRAAVTVSEQWLDGPLPALVSCRQPLLSLAEWLAANRATTDELVRSSGAVLFRGFAVPDAATFHEAIAAFSDEVLSYGERSSPRTEVIGGQVYTSTEHPAAESILPHNEQSYTLNWPMRISFFCDTPPTTGGRTPLVDSRKVLARLSRETVDRFAATGVRYTRNYVDGISLSWSEAFQTDDRRVVEEHCAREGITYEWTADGGLRTAQVRPAVHRHPITGESTWFNHAHFFNIFSMPSGVGQDLWDSLGEDGIPYHTSYGDGSPIDRSTLAELHEAYRAETRSFDWQTGDVLVVENMLTAHARDPFTGPRRILAAMSDSYRFVVGNA